MSRVMCIYHIYVCSNNYEVVKVLLDGGADVYVLDHLGRTPIHVATAWGYPRVLALLLSHSKQHLINHQVFIFLALLDFRRRHLRVCVYTFWAFTPPISID